MPVSPRMQGKVVTVARYIMEEERLHPKATGEFSNLLSEITLAAKLIHREVSKAGLLDVLRNAFGLGSNAEARRLVAQKAVWVDG